MNIWFVRLLPRVIPWKHNKTILQGQYVENVLSHVVKRFPLTVALTHANDNGDLFPEGSAKRMAA